MDWKNLPTWLKGGLITLLIILVLSIIWGFLGIINPSPTGKYNCDIGPVGIVPCSRGEFFMQPIKIGLFLSIPLFLIGALIGLIIQKFRKRQR